MYSWEKTHYDNEAKVSSVCSPTVNMHVQMCILIVIFISGKRKGTNGAWASVFKCLPKVLTHVHRSPESKISPWGSRPNVQGKYSISTVFGATFSDSVFWLHFSTYFVHRCEITSYKYCFQSLLSNYASYYCSILFLTSFLSSTKTRNILYIASLSSRSIGTNLTAQSAIFKAVLL